MQNVNNVFGHLPPPTPPNMPNGNKKDNGGLILGLMVCAAVGYFAFRYWKKNQDTEKVPEVVVKSKPEYDDSLPSDIDTLE